MAGTNDRRTARSPHRLHRVCVRDRSGSLEHDQHVDLRARGLAQQHVGGIARVRGPGDRDADQRALDAEPLRFAARIGHARGALGPGTAAPLGRDRGRERRELVGQLEQ